MESMVSIWDEIFFIPKQTGSKKISVEIDPAFVRNPHVFFDIYEKDDLWTVYWRSGMRTNDIIAVARSLNLVKMPAEEAFKNEKFIEAINLASPVFSFE
ncbi:MAG: hypothetical protein IJM06_07370, partial [Firmicutes bacterium]|nr:hypothetical protein [Bacillota bacterium]